MRISARVRWELDDITIGPIRIKVLHARNKVRRSRGYDATRPCNHCAGGRVIGIEEILEGCREAFHSRLSPVKGQLTILIITAQSAIAHYHPGKSRDHCGEQQ